MRPTIEEIAPIRADLARARPDIVLAGFGSPKQERVIAQVRQALPQTWWIGVGISFSFIAEHVKRAPVLTQRLGLEWTHRLIQEPRRLFRRYVIEDLPFAFLLLGRCALERLRGM
jgi:N-acetylglucosaminyldiphosphoundecaprenol N-acetyl-beta-D-mannosaminyltransferase